MACPSDPGLKKERNATMAITIQLKKERETKNTVRFEEMENAEGNPPLVGILYVQKWALKRLGDPETLMLHLEAVPAAP